MRPRAPLRVGMLVHNIYARDARVRRYAEYLADEGHAVDVICLASEDRAPQTNHPNIRVFPIGLSRVRREGLGHVLEWVLSIILMFFRMSRLDIACRYDVIHAHNMPDFIVFCALLPRLRGCPVILDIHDPVPELALSKLALTESHPLIRIQVFLEYISVRFSSHVITASPAFKDALVRRGVPSGKITVVINAADPRIFAPRQQPERTRELRHSRFVLLYVGTVAARYGLDVLAKALTLLRPEIPGIRLQIVPKLREEGKGLTNLLELCRKLRVDDLVEVAEPVPLEGMPAIMEQADLGVYPAIRDCHMDLALSLKIPEMVNLCLPIVAARLPILETLYGDDCMAFFPSGDHVACAEKILELYRFPEKRHRLASNALQKSGALTWESQYKKYRSVLCQVLGIGPDALPHGRDESVDGGLK